MAPLLCAAWLVAPALGQEPLTAVNDGTEVRSIAFRFAGSSTFGAGELRRHIALTDPSSVATVDRFLANLGIGRSLPRHPFQPVELQRDVVRLRRFYERAGFIDPSVDYEVTFDEAANQVEVVFVIDEGRPITVVALRGVWHGDSVPDRLRKPWSELIAGLPIVPPARLDRAAVEQTEGAVVAWLAERAYPFARARSEAAVDSATGTAQVLLHATPGPVSRIGSIVIDGNETVADAVVRHALPFRPGDLFSAGALNRGAQRLRSFGIFKLVRVDLVPEQLPDTVVAVRVYVQEDRPRRVTGQVGYVSDGGVAAQAEWLHRNFWGGARSLSITGAGQSGWLAWANNPDRFARGVVTLRQPQLIDRRIDGVLSPFAEYRDDYRDQSWQVGLRGTLLYQLGPIQSVALQYQISRRQIIQYRFGDFSSGEIDILTLLALASAGVLDSLGESFNESVFSITGTFGTLDNPPSPRRGFVVRPSVSVTAPSAFNTTEYSRVDVAAFGYYPIGQRSTIAVRLAAGRLFPYGKSLPEPGDNAGLEYLQLRDVAFTAGGTNDVRGWGSRELGPKFPDVRINVTDSSVVATRYIPIGGLSRLLSSVEARLPMPLLGPRFGSHVFLDGGRVWTSDDRFQVDADSLRFDDYYWAIGAGIDVRTPVGPLRLSVGYKLNPSPLDVRDPQDVLLALVDGRSLDTVPTKALRRFEIHFALGITY